MRPDVEDTREQAALAAALLIGAQLLLGYWFYSYLTWCYPLLIIAIIHQDPGWPRAAGGMAGADPGTVQKRNFAARRVGESRVDDQWPGR
jgi:hypothetical protein